MTNKNEEVLRDLSEGDEQSLLSILIHRQRERAEEKAKALSDNELVVSYLERPFAEEERLVTNGDRPTSTKKYDEDELRWHRGDVCAATMVMMDVCDATETLTMLQGLCRFISNSQVTKAPDLPEGVYWSDFAEQILSEGDRL